jgi:hypothetical protein
MMTLSEAVSFELDVMTADTITAASLASLAKTAVLFRKMTASPDEKAALENTMINSTQETLQLHFRTDGQRFDALIKSNLLAALSK